MKKTQILLILFFLLVPSLTVAQTSRSERVEANKYIGFRYSGEPPSEFKDLGGWDTGNDFSNFVVNVVQKGKVKMVWLGRVTPQDSSGRPYIEVVNVLILPPMSPSQTVLYSICLLGKKYDSEILAIVEKNPKDNKFFGKVTRAWRVKLSPARFMEISPKGIRCDKGPM